jgi:hypothetical protein
MKGHSLVLAIMLFSSLCVADHDMFSLAQHRWTFGGSASLPTTIDRNSIINTTLHLQPVVGYFVYDNLELSASATLDLILASGARDGRKKKVNWGFGMASRYFFSTSSIVYPYLGAGFSFDAVNLNASTTVYHYRLLLGVLIAVHPRVALDFGLPIEIQSAAGLFQQAEFKPAYLGLQFLF